MKLKTGQNDGVEISTKNAIRPPYQYKGKPMIKLKIEPYPKQVQFFQSTKRYIAYGGARGGGKSWAARTKAVMLALNYNGIQILILRRTLKELRENHVLPLMTQLKDIAKYNAERKAVLRATEGARTA